MSDTSLHCDGTREGSSADKIWDELLKRQHTLPGDIMYAPVSKHDLKALLDTGKLPSNEIFKQSVSDAAYLGRLIDAWKRALIDEIRNTYRDHQVESSAPAERALRSAIATVLEHTE